MDFLQKTIDMWCSVECWLYPDYKIFLKFHILEGSVIEKDRRKGVNIEFRNIDVDFAP